MPAQRHMTQVDSKDVNDGGSGGSMLIQKTRS